MFLQRQGKVHSEYKIYAFIAAKSKMLNNTWRGHRKDAALVYLVTAPLEFFAGFGSSLLLALIVPKPEYTSQTLTMFSDNEDNGSKYCRYILSGYWCKIFVGRTNLLKTLSTLRSRQIDGYP
uniref:Uncharacterized protein n=1 Tax=Glossina austeni TaxID=7395 RepID=A0A1A9VAD6_GLOAU